MLCVVVVSDPGGSSEAEEGATGAVRAGSPEYGALALADPVGGRTSKACWPGLTSWSCSRAIRAISAERLRFFRSWASAASCSWSVVQLRVRAGQAGVLMVERVGREPGPEDDGRQHGATDQEESRPPRLSGPSMLGSCVLADADDPQRTLSRRHRDHHSSQPGRPDRGRWRTHRDPLRFAATGCTSPPDPSAPARRP